MEAQFLAELRNTPADQLIDALALYLKSNGGGGSATDGRDGTDGTDGKSAYQSWLELPQNAGKTEAQFAASLVGRDGLSVLDVWHLAGGQGNEQDFINSLSAQTGLSIAAIRNLSAPASSAQKVIALIDSSKQGVFQANTSDTTTADDGALTLVTSSGVRYARVMPDRIITPQMFGAVGGSGTTDDTSALLAWFSTTGNVEHKLPAGSYKTMQALNRNDLGSFTLRGGGPTKSKILFAANTQGMSVVNTTSSGSASNPGQVTLEGFEIQSTSTKTGTKEALLVTTQHEQRPGPTLNNLGFKCMTAGQEWKTFIHLHDCSGTTIINPQCQGSGPTNVTDFILYTNSPNRPSVEHNIYSAQSLNVRRGIVIQSATTGGNGIEGVNIFGGAHVGVRQGIVGSSVHLSPLLNIFGTHVASYGGEGIYLSGYQQLALSNILLYTSDWNGEVPGSSVYIENSLQIDAKIQIFSDSTTQPTMVKLGDAVAGGRFWTTAAFNNNATHLYEMATGNSATVDGERLWRGTGNASPEGKKINVLDNTPGHTFLRGSHETVLPPDKSMLAFDLSGPGGYQYRPVPRYLVDRTSIRVVSATGTLNMAEGYSGFDVNNVAANVTLTIDVSTLTEGQKFTLGYYDNNCTGSVTLLTNNGAVFFRDATGTFAASYVLPKLSTRHVTFHYFGGIIKLLTGMGELGTISSQPYDNVTIQGGNITGLASLSANAIVRGRHFKSNGATPSWVLGTGAGTGATMSISGSEGSHTILLTTGSAPAADSIVATITIATPTEENVRPNFSNVTTSASMASQVVQMYGTGVTTYVLRATLVGSTTYAWNVSITE